MSIRHASLFIIIGLVLTVMACEQSGLSDTEIENLKTEVLQVTMARNAAYLATDADLAFSYFSRASGVIEVEGGHYQNITNERLEGMRTFYGSVEDLKIDLGTPQIKILGREAAMVFIDGNWSYTVKKTKETISESFVMTLIWVKEDGEWKVFHKHESTPAVQD